MDERYLLAAAKYIERNPVRMKLADKPEAYPWSSAAAHVRGKDDGLVKVSPLLGLIKDWRAFLSEETEEQEAEVFRRHERTGRPLGDKDFVTTLENTLGRVIHPQAPGRKKKL